MPEPPRTQRYEGLFQSQTQEMFDADARSAAEHDWYPASENWTGAVLFVVYEQDPGRRSRATPAAAAAAANPAIARNPKGAKKPKGPKDAMNAPSTARSGTYPPAVQPFESDGPAATGRRRRIAIGAGVGAVVVAALALTMVGSQVLGRPAAGQQSGGTAAATPAGAAAILGTPMGGRAAAVEHFRARAFSGIVSPLVDGRERWRGTDKRSSVAEIIGPEDRITEVSLAVRMLRDEKRNNKARSADLGDLFETYAPLGAQWAADQIDVLDTAAPRSVEQRFGDLLIRLVSMPVKGGAVVKFQIITE